MDQNANLSCLQFNWMIRQSLNPLNSFQPEFSDFSTWYYNMFPSTQALYFASNSTKIKSQDQQSLIKIEETTIPNDKDEIQNATHSKEQPDILQKLNKQSEFEKIQENKIPEMEKTCRNLYRNAVLSFIFNRVLKFLRNSEQSKGFVMRIFEQNGVDCKKAVSAYYKYAHEATKKVINTVSIQKIRQLWSGPQRICGEQRKFYHYIFRCLTRIYLERKLPSVIYETRKLTAQQRQNYLRMRHCLLLNLERPAHFKSYDEF